MIPRFHQHVCGKEGVRERKKDRDRQKERQLSICIIVKNTSKERKFEAVVLLTLDANLQ